MADTPISGLPAASSVSATDRVPLVHSGTTVGATTTEIVNAGGPCFSVDAYGAVGDGVTDDSGAFNSAIAAMPNAITQPASGGSGPSHSAAYGSALRLTSGKTYLLNSAPNWNDGKVGVVLAPGAMTIGSGGIYPAQQWLKDPSATTLPSEPAMLYITEPVPSNRTSTSPQNDDVTAIHIEHHNSGRAGIAIDSKGAGDAIFIGLSDYSYYGLDIVSYAPSTGSPAPAGPMLILNNGNQQNMVLLDIVDYNGGNANTIYIDHQRSGSAATMRLNHSTSAYSGNFIEIDAASGSGTFTGNYLQFKSAGSQLFAIGSDGSIQLGSNFASIRAGSGAPTYSAEGGSLYLRIDGAAGSRLYVNQGVGAFSTTWTAVSGV